MKVSVKNLEKRLMDVEGTRIVSIATETVPQMRKTGNPFVGRVVKQTQMTGIIGFRYENAVNNRRMVEAEPMTQKAADAVPVFEALPRSWGEHIPGTPLVEHNGNKYLEIKAQGVQSVRYLVDGQPADEKTLEEIKSFMPEKVEGARQELEQPVVLRDVKLENIRQLVMDRKVFDVTGK